MSLSLCIHLTFSPGQRLSAVELLQHRFIRGSRRIATLTELIDRYQDFRHHTPSKPSGSAAEGQQTIKAAQGTFRALSTYSSDGNGTVTSAWSFDTMRSEFGVLSTRSVPNMRHALGTDPQEEDEFEYNEDEESGIEEETDEAYECGGRLSQFSEEVVFEEDELENTHDTPSGVSGAMEHQQLQLDTNADSAYSTMTTKVRVLCDQTFSCLMISSPSNSMRTSFLALLTQMMTRPELMLLHPQRTRRHRLSQGDQLTVHVRTHAELLSARQTLGMGTFILSLVPLRPSHYISIQS